MGRRRYASVGEVCWRRLQSRNSNPALMMVLAEGFSQHSISEFSFMR